MQDKKRLLNVILFSLSCVGIVLSLFFLIQQTYVYVSNYHQKEVDFPTNKFEWEKNVLFISSYDSLYPLTQIQLENLKNVFSKNKVHFDAVFLDSRRNNDEDSVNVFKESLISKIENNGFKYDCILTADDPAFSFVLKYENELFDRIPIFYFGVENQELLMSAWENSNVAGLYRKDYIAETIDVALKVNPEKNHVIALCDNTLSGREDYAEITAIAETYTDVSFEIINGALYTYEQLKYGLKSVPKNSIFIFLSFSRDKNGKFIPLAEAVNMVCNSVPVPVYTCSVGVVGNGALGGMIYDCRGATEYAANAVIRLLNGESIESLKGLPGSEGYFCFDLSVASSFGLKRTSFPPDSLFISESGMYYSNLAGTFNSIIGFVVSILILVALLLNNFRISAKRLQELSDKNREIEEKNQELTTSALRLHYLSEKDYLTTLPNRFYIVNYIRRLISKKADFNLMMLDVDDFKFINDYYTHACGDFVLCEIGARLIRISSELGCTVARYGGDEFLIVDEKGVLLEGSPSLDRIREILCQSLVYNKIRMDVFVSCGVSHYDVDWSYDELMGNADIALYESKKKGKNQISFYEFEMRSVTTEKNRIVKLLDEECSKQGFSVRYQPQVNAETGEIYGYEALVRLTTSPMSPGKFIPIAEDSGYITQIGRIVTEKVISQMALWRKNGMKLHKVSINYSNGQLVDSDYVSFLKNTLEKYEIPPSLVEIEITESLFLGNNNLTSRLFDSLRNLGVGLALDDFGTGYSSLSYLTYVPVHRVKIDKSLVDNYLVKGKESFIKNIVRLVHDLGMELTVEGVEHKWQYEKLKELHCDCIQGFYFSKPITAEEVQKLALAG